MANQTRLLQFIAQSPDAALSLDELCQLYQPGAPFGPKTRLRKQVINAMGKLMEKKLAVVVKPPRTQFGGNVLSRYKVTAEGIARHAQGTPLIAAVTGPRKNLPKPKADTLRQRLWEALRLKKKATAAELAELIHQKGDPEVVKVIKNCLDYFARLERAGIVSRLQVRARGFAPTSNGFNRYALIRDLGQIAPSAGRRCVTDQNARERIPYRKKEKAHVGA